MDIQRILQGVANLTGVNQNRLSEAARKAERYKGIRTRDEAIHTLQQMGIDNHFLNRVQGLIDSPIARTVASLIGMNPKEASDAIDQLKTSSPAPKDGSDRLSKFKHDLDRVRK